MLFRHAKSSWNDETLDDFDRPLAKRGRKAANRLADWFAANDIRPELVLCSSARRTRETLDLVRAELGPQLEISWEKPLYLAGAAELLARLHDVPDDVGSVMLVGHNPGLQELALALVGPGARALRSRMASKFPTAAVARLQFRARRWTSLRAGKATLLAYVTPADLGN